MVMVLLLIVAVAEFVALQAAIEAERLFEVGRSKVDRALGAAAAAAGAPRWWIVDRSIFSFVCAFSSWCQVSGPLAFQGDCAAPHFFLARSTTTTTYTKKFMAVTRPEALAVPFRPAKAIETRWP